jgi:plasmid stability protein
MANIQVKNIPEALHERLRAYARRRKRTLGEIVVEAIERELAQAEFRDRLAERPATELGVKAADLLEEERAQRDADTSP